MEVKTCYIRETEKQQIDLAFWPETQQETSPFTCPNTKRKIQSPCPFFLFILSIQIAGFYVANSGQLAASSVSWFKVNFDSYGISQSDQNSCYKGGFSFFPITGNEFFLKIISLT